MKKNKLTGLLMCCVAALLLSSCGKGYDVRFGNYYTEDMDSVIIGNNKIVFTNIKMESYSGYKTLSSGDYSVLLITKSKKKFTYNVSVPKNSSGKRTIQIDGITQIAFLEQ